MAATDPDVRREIGAEREGLVDAVETLRGELADARRRGVRAAIAAGAVFALGVGARVLVRVRRR